MILVYAANGHQGRLLVPKLLAANLPVRACVRTEASADVLRAVGVTDVFVGDMTDPTTVAKAMDGVEKVYHLQPTAHPKQRDMGFTAVDAAKRAGVRHFVLSTVLHSISTGFVQHEMMRDIEEHLIASSLEFTILQPTNYMIPRLVAGVFETGVYGAPYSFDRRQSLVDLADVSDVARMVLASGEEHYGATYELVAPGRYSPRDFVRIFESVLGRPVELLRIQTEDIIRGFFGDPADFPHETYIFGRIFEELGNRDFVGNPNVLTWLLGRRPNTFEEFVRAEYQTYQKQGVLYQPSMSR
jgi:uncharacterized protein YbjT (DUF2867 family)